LRQVRQRHAEASGANGGVPDVLGRAQMRGLEINDDDFEDFYGLLKDARNINSGSYAREVAQFFLDEGNPFIFLILIMNVFGEETWYRVLIPLAINVVTSSIIAYYLTVEKHDVSKSKQGSGIRLVLVDSLKKFTSLINHFCIERTRREKRCEKLERVEKAICKDRNEDRRWISEEGFRELVEYYSSQLRYQKEELLIATLRSSVFVIYNVYSLADRANFALPICRLNDVFKVLYILWIVFKVSAATYNFDKIKLRYVAVTQLWASLRLRANSLRSESCLNTPSFSTIAVEDTVKYKSLNWTLYFMSTFSRFVAATLLVISGGLWGLCIWIAIIVTFNYSLLTLRCSEENIRSIFDNPPTGFTCNRNRLINRFLSTFLFYNHGYSRYYKIPRRTCLTIAFSVVFYLTILFVEGGHIFSTELFSFMAFYNDENIREFHCASIFGNRNSTWYETYERLQCFRDLLKTKPIDALDYIGGLSCSSIFLILFPIVTFIIELVYVHDTIMEDFDKFPFLDAADCVRSLINAVLKEQPTSNNDSQTSKICNLFVLLLGNSEEFETIYAKLSPCNCSGCFREKGKDSGESEDDILSGYAQHNINNSAYSGLTDLNRDDLLELANQERYKFGEYHPLHNEVGLLFTYIESVRDLTVVQRQVCQLFPMFCRHLNQRLCEMSSSRIERTFQLLNVDVAKTYEQNL
ncbi:hypothetical protein Ocin01_15541, partial [Orchesella cincta]